MINRPKMVVLHCADTPDYPDASAKYDLFGAADIDAWHKARGWKGIGYHYVIRRTGIIEVGREESEVGAHTKGYNTKSIGICYIGQKEPTPPQLGALLTLYDKIKKGWDIEFHNWLGHYELTTGKTCPGFSANVLREMLKQWHLRQEG